MTGDDACFHQGSRYPVEQFIDSLVDQYSSSYALLLNYHLIGQFVIRFDSNNTYMLIHTCVFFFCLYLC